MHTRKDTTGKCIYVHVLSTEGCTIYFHSPFSSRIPLKDGEGVCATETKAGRAILYDEDVFINIHIKRPPNTSDDKY